MTSKQAEQYAKERDEARAEVERLKAEINTVRLGGNLHVEVEALRAENAKLRAAVIEARDTFHCYAETHRAKATRPGTGWESGRKAAANEALADRMDAALNGGTEKIK